MSRSLLIAGAVIFLLGMVGFAVRYLTTAQTKDVADVGPLHVETTQHHRHSIPPLLSEAAIAVGTMLMGAALLQRR